MINTEPIVADNGRYTPLETCKALEIHRNTLARYTDSGAIKCGIRKANNRKFYTGSDIKKLWKAQL